MLLPPARDDFEPIATYDAGLARGRLLRVATALVEVWVGEWAVWEMLGRLFISSAILTVPFCLFAVATGRVGGLIWLLFPVVYVPVFLVAAVVVFIPVEKLSSMGGWPVVPALLVSGAVLGALVAFVAGSRGNKRSVIVADVVAGDTAVIATIIGLVAAGSAMGAVWHLSQYVLQR